MTRSFLYFGSIKARAFFLGVPGSADPTVGRTQFAQADRERVVAGALIQKDLAWLRDFFLESSRDCNPNRAVLPAGGCRRVRLSAGHHLGS
jgi:hypothetical protein